MQILDISTMHLLIEFQLKIYMNIRDNFDKQHFIIYIKTLLLANTTGYTLLAK